MKKRRADVVDDQELFFSFLFFFNVIKLSASTLTWN